MPSHKKLCIKVLIPLLCFAGILLFVGCTGNSANGSLTRAPANQQVFRTPLEVIDIATFDPAQGTDLYSIAAIDMVFTGLVQENDQLQVQLQLAQSYEVTQDGLTWTFHLRPHLKFSDGTPLTSQDVAYSIDRALSPQVSALNGISLTYLGLIKGAADRVNGKIPTIIGTGIQTPDTNTVVIHLIQPAAYFLQTLTYPTSYVVEKKVIDQWGLQWTDHLGDNGGQGGDGPFRVQSYHHTTGIIFVPNPNYYGKQPQLQKVAFPFIDNNTTAYLQYRAGQVDQASIPTAYVPQAKKQTNQYHQVPQLDINYYGLNYLVKPFDNIKIRQALDLAINKDVIAQAVWDGQYTPTNHIIPAGMPGYNAHLTGPDGVVSTEGDATKAKQLFDEGLQEEHLTLAQFPIIHFTYSNASSKTDVEITTVIQMWKQVLGITTIKPDAVDTTTLFSLISNTTNNDSLQMWKADWIADYPDPQDWITLQFGNSSAENHMNYGQNNSTDAVAQQNMQQQMLHADGQTARAHAYNSIEQQLVNDVAWLPMQQTMATYQLKPYVVGIVDNALDLTPPDDWGNIYIVAH